MNSFIHRWTHEGREIGIKIKLDPCEQTLQLLWFPDQIDILHTIDLKSLRNEEIHKFQDTYTSDTEEATIEISHSLRMTKSKSLDGLIYFRYVVTIEIYGQTSIQYGWFSFSDSITSMIQDLDQSAERYCKDYPYCQYSA